MELNREQIVKVLECCLADRVICNDCPIQKECESTPFDATLARYALALIRELTEENERLRNRVTATIILTDKDAERIKKECLERVELDIKAIQSDTVRKMQERLKNAFNFGHTILEKSICDIIDQIAKEMWEEDT